MQTITIAHINQQRVDPSQFAARISQLTLRRRLNEDTGEIERLDAPFVEQIESGNRRLRGMATAIIRSRKRETVTERSVRDGYLQTVEREEEVQNFARAWVGHRGYGLFCFLTGSPGGTFPAYRLMLAQSLTGGASNCNSKDQ